MRYRDNCATTTISILISGWLSSDDYMCFKRLSRLNRDTVLQAGTSLFCRSPCCQLYN